MLKITVSREQEQTTFALAGQLTGPWVQELRRCWRSRMEADQAGGCLVDLRDTTYIDAEGTALLSDMHRAGAVFLAVGCMTRAIVEQVTQSCLDTSGQPWSESGEAHNP